ncbi:hypothetical protein RGAI101_4132 [Roseobacter sp. GAI101]|nr:hypothetical protein RGAI101_4132 [Roseobacter sp. GAI101]
MLVCETRFCPASVPPGFRLGGDLARNSGELVFMTFLLF